MVAAERPANIKGNRHDKQMNWLCVQTYSTMNTLARRACVYFFSASHRKEIGNIPSAPSAARAKRAVNSSLNTYELLSKTNLKLVLEILVQQLYIANQVIDRFIFTD
jgi:hypothetical protein